MIPDSHCSVTDLPSLDSCQSLLAGWQNKRGAALPDCSWKVPPLRPDIYRSPRGIHTHCHLSPKAIWGYRPCFTALIRHEVLAQLRCISRCKVEASGNSTQHVPKGMQSCMKLSPGVADSYHSKEKYKIQHFSLGPVQFLRSESRNLFQRYKNTASVVSADVQLYLFWGILRALCFFIQVTES